MGRTFDAMGLVSLPRLDAAGALALGSALLAAAGKQKKLPAGVVAAKKKLGAAHGKVQAALRDRLQPASGDAERVRAADRAEDAAWSALHDFLYGWTKLPASFAQAAQARSLYETLFPDGLAFTRLPFKQEWAEVDARLQQIAAGPLEPSLRQLGAGPFLENLRAAHAEYGRLLGVTRPAAQAAPPKAVKQALTAFAEALRSYTLQLAARADEGDAKLASALLAPLADWQSPVPAQRKPKAASKAPSAPTAPPSA